MRMTKKRVKSNRMEPSYGESWLKQWCSANNSRCHLSALGTRRMTRKRMDSKRIFLRGIMAKARRSANSVWMHGCVSDMGYMISKKPIYSMQNPPTDFTHKIPSSSRPPIIQIISTTPARPRRPLTACLWRAGSSPSSEHIIR